MSAGAAPDVAYLKALHHHDGAQYGSTVALDAAGGVLMVGAPREDGNGRNIAGNNNPADDSLPDAGAAYLY